MIYLLKLNVSLMMLYGFYRMMMSHDTFFGYRRIGLLCILAMSMMVPMLNLQSLLEHNATAMGMATVYADYVLPVVPVYASSPAFTWVDALTMVYWGGVGVMTLRLLFQLGSILRQVFVSSVVEVEGMRIHRTDDNSCPFSFCRWIFVGYGGETPEQLHEILVHERAHVDQWHSLDVMAAEIFCVFNWFNPFSYLMKHEIRLNLEYLADEAVIDEGNARKSYQYHLLGLAYRPARRDMANHFNVLPLKKRIKMMNKRRTKEIAKAKYLLFVPLAAALLAVSNIEMVAHSIGNNESPLPDLPGQNDGWTGDRAAYDDASKEAQLGSGQAASDSAVNKQNREIFDNPEVMPVFSGGQEALMQYFSNHLKYPKECYEQGIQGRVIVNFVVNKDGSVSDAKVFRGIDPRLDGEALRVVQGMPHWTPGKVNGKTVRVSFTIPVSFKIPESKVKGNAYKHSNIDLIAEYYPGGIDALMGYLIKNAKYPAVARQLGAEGMYYAMLKVKADGSYVVQDVARSNNIEQQIDGAPNVVVNAVASDRPSETDKAKGYEALGKEAWRLAKGLSRFKAPGKEMMVTIPISFRLK